MVKRRSQVPKWIAGLKILNPARKGRLATLLSTPADQILFAELLLVIGGAIATAANPDSKQGRALRKALNEGFQELKDHDAGNWNKRDIGRHLGKSLGRAFDAFRQSMRDEPVNPTPDSFSSALKATK